jgi:hypothetical protein
MSDFKVTVEWAEKNPYRDTDPRYFTWRAQDCGRKCALFPEDAPAIQAMRDADLQSPWGLAAALIPKDEVRRLALARAGYERGLVDGKNYSIVVSDDRTGVTLRRWHSWN